MMTLCYPRSCSESVRTLRLWSGGLKHARSGLALARHRRGGALRPPAPPSPREPRLNARCPAHFSMPDSARCRRSGPSRPIRAR
jgi:hypothetical protein